MNESHKAPERVNVGIDRRIWALVRARQEQCRRNDEPVPSAVSILESWIRSSPAYKKALKAGPM